MRTQARETLTPPVGGTATLTVEVRDGVLDIPCVVWQGVEEDELLLVLPDRSTYGLPVTGEALMSWAVPRGAAQQRVHLRPQPPDGWRVRPDGPARVVQRRKFARAYEEFAAELEIDDGLLSVVGRDVSEAGFRCRLPEGVELPVGSKARARLHLEALRVDAEVTVVRLVAVDENSYEAGVTMCLPERDADQVRRHVFAVQMRELRSR